MWSLQRFEEALALVTPEENRAPKRAAVAAILRFAEPAQPEVLLMRRAERAGDRWSGQISFPGGKEEAHDTSLLHTAMRETREEVGIDLTTSARFLGALPPLQAIAKGKPLSTGISPFVFVQTEDCAVELSEEAVRVFWLPLAEAAEGAFDHRHAYQMGEQRLLLPSWHFDGETVWGLTFKMLQTLLETVRT